MIIGAQRGIFSSEAGIGTGAIASSTTLTTTKEEQIRNSYIQMLGIYITTFLIYTSTAFIILTSDINLLSFNNLNGIELVQLSFLNHIGIIGKFFVFIIIFAFSFTTILSSYYNGESSLKYFIEKPKLLLMFLKLLTFISIIIGSISKSNFIWNLIDIFVGLLAIINIYAIIKLKDEVFSLLKSK
jgi:AGCS family alanine or glycine:cation symporter